MTAQLVAEFAKRFRNGPLIEAAIQLPTATFSITVLFGPSGAGKTTVLRCLAGLDRPDHGFIHFGEETWFDAVRRVSLPPQRRGIGCLFQEYALFPHLNVAQNIAYSLRGLEAAARQRCVQEMIDLFGLTGLNARYPRQLSGGQQQRVALARALARRPRLLLLDEPLSALDTPTREQLRRELRRLLAELSVPALLVTHDRLEAVALGDRVVILHEGRVCQSGPVAQVFTQPVDVAVARIVGIDTIEPAMIREVAQGLATVAVGSVQLVARMQAARWTGKSYVCIRAEDVLLAKHGTRLPSGCNQLTGQIRALVREGPMLRINLDCGFPLTALVPHPVGRELDLQEGGGVTVSIPDAAIHLIPRD
jgi:molybdate transport system ATP-binding protein